MKTSEFWVVEHKELHQMYHERDRSMATGGSTTRCFLPCDDVSASRSSRSDFQLAISQCGARSLDLILAEADPRIDSVLDSTTATHHGPVRGLSSDRVFLWGGMGFFGLAAGLNEASKFTLASAGQSGMRHAAQLIKEDL